MSEIAAAGVRPAWRGGLGAGAAVSRGAPDVRRLLQLALAGIWLLDAVLQYQSFMFSKGFSQMLAGTASGNPGVVASPITWNATLVDHHAVLLNTLSPRSSCCWRSGSRGGRRYGWRWPPRSPGRSACGGSARDSGWC